MPKYSQKLSTLGGDLSSWQPQEEASPITPKNVGTGLLFFFLPFLDWRLSEQVRFGQKETEQTFSDVKTCFRERSFTAGAQGRFLNGKTEEFCLSAPPVWVQKTYMPYLVLYIILLIAESFGNLQEYLCGCLLILVKVRISFSGSFLQLIKYLRMDSNRSSTTHLQEVKRKSPGYANSKQC